MSCARRLRYVPTTFVAMTRAGETGGVLEDSLMRVADQLEKEDALRRQVKSAMVYPGVVLSFALIVLVGLVTFIVPVFVGVFKQFDEGELRVLAEYWERVVPGASGLT